MDEATASGYKICNLCGKPKPLDEFPFRSDGLKRRPRCRICIVKTANGSQAAREAQDRFHKVHPDKRAEYFARWREANPDYSYEKQLRETDPDKYRTLVDARNARRRLLTSEPCKHEACSSGINRRAVWGRDERHCRIKLVCDGDFVPFEEMHMDHVVPLSKGGLHCYYNVQTGCAPCNLAKSNRILEVVG